MTVLPLEIIEHYGLEEFVTNLDSNNTELINFLHNDLAISAPSIALALRYCQQDCGPLPMVLWRYGFVSLEQLNQIFDWLEN